MKIPEIKIINTPLLIVAASQLSPAGKLAVSHNNLTYLNIDDNYIHQLFPLLKNQEIKKPDYFGDDSVGAHITVIYPEENKVISA
jgi:hypothetical protein